MPKRILDGDAMHASDKIAACDLRIPATAGVYYPWLYVLCDCNGSFELSSHRVIWAQVSQGLPFLKLDHVTQILEQFHSKGLLFIWTEGGKSFGHWTASNVEGRLPKPSHRERYQVFAPPVPRKELEEYIKRFAFNSLTHRRDVSPVLPVVGVGVGIGVGIGKGEGVGATAAAPHPPSHPLLLIWQDEHGVLPAVQELSFDRLGKCRLRIKSHASDPERFLAKFREAVRKATQNAFLTGSNDRGWKANFDWFIANDSNYLKVLEGKYDGGANGAGSSKQRVADETDQKALRQLREDAERRRNRSLQ